ncbi:MAG: hypothetical protein L0H79_01785 [Intrasporangium sp.]|uniref:DUF6541 family protein n=1 Tax=Intrasporangium sp. TaxID=1925024 RepID=UPI0026474539|nr:DUF6541 family protein [Intrasporangium sp.]MDN5794467.1 hypothetical protein [Intrasporangium sp.]
MGILVPGTTSWPEAIPIILLGLSVLFVPGLVAALVLRLSLLASVAVAPLLSTACVAGAGIVYERLGVRWGVPAFVGAVLLLWSGAWALNRAQASLSGSSRLRTRVGADDRHRSRMVAWARELRSPTFRAVGIGTLLAFAVVCLSVLPEVGTPEAIPQHPDTIFHLGAAEWMLESGSISSLTVGRFAAPGTNSFYPAAFHGFTATIAMLTGTSVAVATSTFVLVLVGVVWPVGCIWLALSLLDNRPAVAIGAGIMSAAFTGFPYLLMGYGVLWPNLFGQTMLPAALVLFLCAIRSRGSSTLIHPSRLVSSCLLVVSLVALVLAHPSALIAFGVMAALILLAGAVAFAARHLRDDPMRGVGRLVVAVVLVLVGTAAMTMLRPASMVGAARYGPDDTAAFAWTSMLLFAPGKELPLWALAIATGAGALAILIRRPGARWVVAALSLFLALYWLNVAVDTTWVRYLTWPWYNDAFRLQAVAILPAVIAATAGVVAMADVLGNSRVFRRQGLDRAAPDRPSLATRWSSRMGAATLVSLSFLLVTGGDYLHQHRHVLHTYFHPSVEESWVSDQELQALHDLASHLPADAVVAANPWNGATYLYVISGRRLLVPTEKAKMSQDQQLLSKHLNQVGTDPAVCAAAERYHVEWAITGGEAYSYAGDRVDQYTGIDLVGSSPAWRRVARAEPYTLYQRVACATAAPLIDGSAR